LRHLDARLDLGLRVVNEDAEIATVVEDAIAQKLTPLRPYNMF
jgi:hypothetical protein